MGDDVLLTVNEGTLVTVTAKFRSIAGVLTDPNTITLRYSPAGGATVTWVYQGAGNITRSAAGVYVAALDTTGLPGVWKGSWIGTGACQVTMPCEFTVAALPV